MTYKKKDLGTRIWLQNYIKEEARLRTEEKLYKSFFYGQSFSSIVNLLEF